MSTNYTAQLYQLLPAVHQIRDSGQQQALKNLMRVIGEHVQQVHDDIARLYDNWFIETCDDWVVPYIADLVGFRRVEDPGEPGDAVPTASNPFAYPRREVANTVRLRRRKGTLSVLEDLARNVAGWPARAVEFGRLLLSTTHNQFPDLPVGTTLDFRDPEVLERISTPFNSVAHLADFRAIQSKTPIGWYGPAKVGLFVWQRHIVPATQARLRCLALGRSSTMLFSLHPLGAVCPLHVRPEREEDAFGIAGEVHLPVLLSRWLLAASDGTADTRFYGPGKTVLISECDSGTWKPIEACRVLIMDLSRVACRDGDDVRQLAQRILGRLSPNGRRKKSQADRSDQTCQRKIQDPNTKKPELFNLIQTMLTRRRMVVLDPETGRLLTGVHGPDQIRATWHAALPTLMGGGEYDRDYVIPSATEFARIRLFDELCKSPGSLEDILPELAKRAWKAKDKPRRLSDESFEGIRIENSVGIELAASGTWTLKDSLGLEVWPGVVFELRARNRTRPVIELDGQEDPCGKSVFKIKLHPGSRLVLDGLHLTGDALEITFCSEGNADPAEDDECAKEEGARLIPPAEILISHSTLMPLAHDCHCEGGRGPQLRILGERGRVCISRSVIGGMQVSLPDCDLAHGGCPVLFPELHIEDSILDAPKDGDALSSELGSFASSDLTIKRSTVFGATLTQRIKADDCLFVGAVKARQPQEGFLRYCYLEGIRPSGQLGASQTPRRFRCQPDLWESQPVQSRFVTQLEPVFYSIRYGHPGYGQLTVNCPKAISQGAESESEMGFTHEEFLPQRRARLQRQLEDFTPADMQSALIYAEELISYERNQ